MAESTAGSPGPVVASPPGTGTRRSLAATVSLTAHSSRVCTGAYGTPSSSNRRAHSSESRSAMRSANRAFTMTWTSGCTKRANSPSTSGSSMISMRSSASSSLKKNGGVSAHTNTHTRSRHRYIRNWGDTPVPSLLAPKGRKIPGRSIRIEVFIAFTACNPDTVSDRTAPRVARSISAAAIAVAPSAPCS